MASTPEEAARGGIPAEYARAFAVEVSPDGLHAAVLLETNTEPILYPCLVHCDMVGDEWVEGGSSGAAPPAFTWSRYAHNDERGHGVLTYVGEAPSGASSVVIRWRGQERSVPVSRGMFFIATWDVPDRDSGDRPEIVAFQPSR